MKKFILFVVSILVIPFLLCLGFSLFSDNIRIGQGGNSLENKLMGKEVLIEMNGLYKSMDVEEYVLGILPGTIPADYDIETLKVQAILIRTNVLKEMQENNTSDAADLSYQYLTVEDRMALWGEKNYEKYADRFEQAVVATAGMVVKQEDSLIMALYHEVSIGKTASAKEILGEDISYLQSVESSQDVEAKHYMNLVTYTWQEFRELAGNEGQIGEEASQEAQAEDSTKSKEEDGDKQQTESGASAEETAVQKIPVSVEESTENGFVKKLSVNGTIYTGEEAMQKFSLTSANFYVEEIDDGIRFVCLGKGSCLGVSQYGANRMALEGKKAEAIIKYYYKGVSLKEFQS